jgi:hypothetical protein
MCSFINLSALRSNLFVDILCWRRRICADEHLLARLALGDTHRDATPPLLSYRLKLFAEMVHGSQDANVMPPGSLADIAAGSARCNCREIAVTITLVDLRDIA